MVVSRFHVAVLCIALSIVVSNLRVVEGIEVSDLKTFVTRKGEVNAGGRVIRSGVMVRKNESSRVPDNFEDDDDDDGNDEKVGVSRIVQKPMRVVEVRKRRINAHRLPVVEEEEQKVRNATVKLVIWLRNRLRKRLGEIASLEEGLETEKILLKTLKETIENQTRWRREEIRLKVATQKRLQEVGRQSQGPELELRKVQSEAKTLSDQLALLGEKYNRLAETHRNLEDRLRSGGVSHWLDARGEEYLPRTAVGVLCKWTEMMGGISESVGKVVELDSKLAGKVEEMVPGLGNGEGFVGEVFGELVMLVPLVPVVVVMCRIVQMFERLSVLHIVMYMAGGFAAEGVLVIVGGVLCGNEVVTVMQRSNERVLSGAILINGVIYVCYLCTQILVTVVRFCKVEAAQTLLATAVGYHYFLTVLKPVVTNTAVRTSGLCHTMAVVNFLFVMYEKKRVLGLHSRFDRRLNDAVVQIEGWVCETVQAMSSVFDDEAGDVGDVRSVGTVGSVNGRRCVDGRWSGARIMASTGGGGGGVHRRSDVRRSVSGLSCDSTGSGLYASCVE